MAQSQLKVLRQTRGLAKRQMTLLEQWLQTTEVENYKLDSIVDSELKIDDLRGWRERFNTYHEKITVVHIQLEATDEELENHHKDFDDFERRYSAAMTKLNLLVENAKKEVQAESQQHYTANAVTNRQITSSTSLKLPQIELPNFDGQLVNYQAFNETFRALVHNDVRLSAVQKFFYLKGCLKNITIFAEISSLELTEQNYKLAWELLISRFENKKALINKHIKLLFNLPKAERNSASSLRQLLDNVSKHIYGIKGQRVFIPDAILNYLVTSKVDELTHQLWEAHDQNINFEEVATFESLKTFLSNRARALENVEEFNIRRPGSAVVGQNPGKPMPTHGAYKYGNKNISTPRNVYAALQNSDNKYLNKRYSGTCAVCHDMHPAWSCPTFLSKPVKDRLEVAKAKGLCEICLNKHSTEDCKNANWKCKVCMDSSHHTLLHHEK